MRFASWAVAAVLVSNPASAEFLPGIRVTPVRAPAGSGDITLTISGTNFTPNLVAAWNGQPRRTTFVSQWTLKTTIPAADLAQPGLLRVSLWNADAGTAASTEAAIPVYLPLRSRDLVWDASRARLYASLLKTDPNGPALAIIDPEKGMVERYTPLPSDAGPLALSAGAHYLYVGMQDRIRRMDLSGTTADLDIPFSGPVASLLVLAGDGTSFVATFGTSFYSAVVFDGGIRRPNQSNDAPQCLVAFAGDALYGGPGFRQLNLDANGLPFAAAVTANIAAGPGCPVFANGVLYASDGDVVDPAGPTRTSRFGAYGLVDVDTMRGRAWFAGFEGPPDIGNPAAFNLMLFDLTSHGMLASVALPVAALSSANGRLVHWGADGVAFGDSVNGIYLITTSELNP